MKKIMFLLMIIFMSTFVFAYSNSERENCYNNGDGTRTCNQGTDIINYYDGNNYQPINTTILESDYIDYDYEVEKSKYKVYFKSDPTSGQSVKFMYDNNDINFQPMGLNYRNDLNQLQQIQMIDSVVAYPWGNRFIYENAYGNGIHLEYNTEFSYLKEYLIIDSFDNLTLPEQYIIDGGNATLDLDFIISSDSRVFIEDVEWNKQSTVSTTNEVLIKDQQDNILYQLSKPYATDFNSTQQLTYEFKKSGNSLYVTIKTPYEWLESATYPVRIDPTVGFSISGSAASTGSFDCGWSSISNVLIFSDAVTTCDTSGRGTSDQLDLTNYGFNLTGVVLSVDGIESIIRAGTSGADVDGDVYQLLKAGTAVGTNRWSSGQALSQGSLTNYSFGSGSDKWGTTWSQSDIENSGFGVRFRAEGGSGGSETEVAYGFLRVTYTTLTDPWVPFFPTIEDNDGTFFDFGTVEINYSVNESNGSNGLTFNGINRTCVNIANPSNFSYDVSCNFTISSPGTFNYFTHALGNGTDNNFNQSATQTYTIGQSGVKKVVVFDWDKSDSGSIVEFGWFTNKLKLILNTDVEINQTLDVTGNTTMRDSVFMTNLIGGSTIVTVDTSTGLIGTTSGFTGNCANVTYSGGLAVSCND